MKNNSIFKKLTLTILAMGIAFSCTDFLDQEVNGQLADADFYRTDNDAMAATAAVYDQLSNCYTNVWASMYLIRQIYSDESNAAGGDANDQAGYQQLDDFAHDSQNDQISGVWTRLWSTINRANNVINLVPNDNALRDRLIAESKALRAYVYLDLVSFWGDVPLLLASPVPSELPNAVRVPKSEIYAQMEKDLTEAIAVLPLKSAYSAGDKFRWSKGAAQALLGKVYLYQEKWSDAAAIFETVITSGEFGLMNKQSWAFDKGGEFGKESLFEISQVTSQAYDWGNYPWGNNVEANIILQLMGPRADPPANYQPVPGDTLVAGWGFNLPTAKIGNAFVAAGDNTRRRESLMSIQELKDAGGNWGTGVWDEEGFVRRKYGSFNTQNGGPVGELNYGTDWQVLRYADVLLMAAEANFRNNNEAKAHQYLNLVRQRPGTNLPAITPSGTALFDAIVRERFLELCFEGHRFVDLVRWGLAASEMSGEGFVAGKHELLPIPNNDIVSTKMVQNPGY